MSTGSGKTSITCAILSRIENSVQIKIGPDFIDPLIEQYVSGVHGYNIDRWIQGDQSRDILSLASSKGNVGVVEGVMGLYDSGIGKEFSTLSYFKRFKIPYILVVDMQKWAESVFHAAKGFILKNCIGVILNRYTGERHLKLVEDVFKEHNVRIIGKIPYDPAFELGERYLGLSLDQSGQRLKNVGKNISQYIDFSFLEDIPDVDYKSKRLKKYNGDRTVAVAKDEAFCFYYESSMDFLKENFKVEFFSPLRDEIPRDPDFIYIGGGYPELHPEKLEQSEKLTGFLRDFSRNGGKIYAECGGTMYLLEKMKVGERTYDMAGIFNGISWMEKRPILNYTKLRTLSKNPMFGRKQIVYGHEFHYGRIRTDEKLIMKMERGTGINGEDGLLKNNCLGMYTHVDLRRYEQDIMTHFT